MTGYDSTADIGHSIGVESVVRPGPENLGPWVKIPSALASGAHQVGEESHAIVFCVARAADTSGSGRVLFREAETAGLQLFSSKQWRRIVQSEQSERYWELDRHFLRLKSEATILQSFSNEILLSGGALVLEQRFLTTRPRRGAALLAAMLAGVADPRSNQFIQRFARVDRKTLSRWMRDPVIRDHILVREERWAD